MRTANAVGAVDAEIMLRVLIEIFSTDSIVTRRRFPRQGEVALVYLKGAAADANAGAVAVE